MPNNNIASLPVPPRDRRVGLWLLLVCFMIFGQVVIGGVTRLTGSGLSIMEWKPIMGLLPPLTQSDWQKSFELYQQTAQFKHINAGMDLAGFKDIFFWEYVHRVWARLIGFVFLIPFLWFLLKGQIRREWRGRLVFMFVLGGLQGLMGWIMVASGFEERTSVSQYRLVAHLDLALLIYGYIFWSALDLLQPSIISGAAPSNLRRHGWLMLGLIALEITIGGFVAGLHGGLIYNDFPFMGGRLVPDDLLYQQPWWINFLERPGSAQFLHRVTALLVFLAVCNYVLRLSASALPPVLKSRGTYLILAVMAQIALGITTLMLVVPVDIAVSHQAGAIILFTLALFALHGLKRVRS
jgi:cytochrome c oxidase assembly protein subunit 15